MTVTSQQPLGACHSKWTEFVNWLAFLVHTPGKNPVRKESGISQDANVRRMPLYAEELQGAAGQQVTMSLTAGGVKRRKIWKRRDL